MELNDTQRLEFLATCERTTGTSKFMVQVISKGGYYVGEYFAVPPHGMPEVIHADRITAMRSAIDKAYQQEHV